MNNISDSYVSFNAHYIHDAHFQKAKHCFAYSFFISTIYTTSNPLAKIESYISVSISVYRFSQHLFETKGNFLPPALNIWFQSYQSIYDY